MPTLIVDDEGTAAVFHAPTARAEAHPAPGSPPSDWRYMIGSNGACLNYTRPVFPTQRGCQLPLRGYRFVYGHTANGTWICERCGPRFGVVLVPCDCPMLSPQWCWFSSLTI